MLQFFRKIIGSKVGAAIGVLFLALIVFAFAGGDVGNMFKSAPGSSNPADTVATVGDTAIPASAVRQAANAALQNVREQQPEMSMQGFIAAGQLEAVLDSLIDRAAMLAWGKQHNIAISDRLIDSEIAKLPAFQGPDGKFSQSIYRQLIQQRGLSDALIRNDIAETLIARQLMVPASFGAAMPISIATQYAQLLKETRIGTIAVLPAPLFAPPQSPSDSVLTGWYAAHRNVFLRPERRAIRYAVLSAASLKAAAPTDAEIAARYKADAAKYAATETRTLTQLVVLGEADANAAGTLAAKGTSLATIAQAKGLATTSRGPIGKAELAAATTPQIADAVFAAPKGGLVKPLRGPLGWMLFHVDAVAITPARSLEQARPEIVAALTADRQKQALGTTTSEVEDSFDKGSSLADTAKALGLTVQQTGPLTADGHVYGVPGQTAPPELAKVLKTAFQMEQEHQPQLAETEAGQSYVLFEVSQITPSAPAPFAEIRQDVIAAYALDKGNAAAQAAAKQVLAQVKKGGDLAQVIAALGKPVPAPQPVTMNRDQLLAMQQQSGQQVPPPLGLLFSMAQGTTKLLPAAGNRGWYLVSLKTIVPGKIAAGDPLVAQASHDLGQILGEEYGSALRKAIRAEVGARRNEAAFAALKRELSGAAAGTP
jgi:peptidyl-prolyl cis-trans isomerase D